jgi:alpha-methylacyl-CoA racemase
MTDGSALLGAMLYGLRAHRSWSDAREANMLDGGAPFYDTYACLDGKFLSVGAIEPQFYAQLLELTGATDPDFQQQWNRHRWPDLKAKFAALFATRPRDAWCALLEGTDACFAPVLDMEEAPRHPHNAARGTFVEVAGVTQPAPAPRFSRTAPSVSSAPGAPGEHSADILADWGWTEDAIAALISAQVISDRHVEQGNRPTACRGATT